jgi:hypothetical protein
MKNSERVDKLQEKLDCIDNESKVNTRTWIRDNYVKFFMIVAVGGVVAGYFASKFIGYIIK